MKIQSALLSILALVVLLNEANAQQTIQPTYSQLPMGSPVYPSTYPNNQPTYPGYPSTYPSYPSTYPSYPSSYPAPTTVYPSMPTYPNSPPSYPMMVTPNQVTGVNQWTGGYDTANQQINNTVFAPGRGQSAGNGTGRWVNRPVYGNGGQIVGHQQGYVWNNSLTGQEHGELNTFTPNGLGGVNNTATSYMTQGNTGRPSVGSQTPRVRSQNQSTQGNWSGQTTPKISSGQFTGARMYNEHVEEAKKK